jgi:hypothetical protein
MSSSRSFRARISNSRPGLTTVTMPSRGLPWTAHPAQTPGERRDQESELNPASSINCPELRTRVLEWQTWLRHEKRQAAASVKAYQGDLLAFLAFCAEHLGERTRIVEFDMPVRDPVETVPTRFPPPGRPSAFWGDAHLWGPEQPRAQLLRRSEMDTYSGLIVQLKQLHRLRLGQKLSWLQDV